MELIYRAKYKLTEKLIKDRSVLRRNLLHAIPGRESRYLKGFIWRSSNAYIRNKCYVYEISFAALEGVWGKGRKIIINHLSELKEILKNSSEKERTIAKRMNYYLRKYSQAIDLSIRSKIVEQKLLGNI
jgi:hypothetical protein